MSSSKRLRRLARCGPWSLHQIDTINHRKDRQNDAPASKPGSVNREALSRSGRSVQLRISIAKRFIPLAVERNRLRRIVKESFRKRLDPQAQASAEPSSKVYLLRLDQSFDKALATSVQALSTRRRKVLYWQSLEALWQAL